MPDAETKRVLVTGAGGFTGRFICRALEDHGYRVVPLPGSSDEGGVDLRDRGAVMEAVGAAEPDFAVHLAALSFVGHEPASDFYDVNLFGTLNLLDGLCALQKPPRKVILASSANLYGAAGKAVLDEDVCPRPVNHYGLSKLAMEHMAATYFDRLPIILTRPFNYSGPGQEERFLLPKIVSHFRRRAAAIEMGNTWVARDFSDVRDIAEDYARLLVCDAAATTVNLCSGEATTIDEVLSILTGLTGHSLEVRVNPAFVRADEIPSLRGSRARIDSLIKPRARRSLRDTLEAMLAA